MISPMDVLALEPYYGGSHRAFLDGWVARSRHRWTVLTLPAHHWKWRMRHAAVSFADEARHRCPASRPPAAVFCSDMLNLPEFLGLAPAALRTLPAVAYFHENQLAYPDPRRDERDAHFGITNLLTAHAATSVWFNSAYHRDTLLSAGEELLRAMPDYRLEGLVERLARRSRVLPPGIEPMPPRPPRPAGPLRVLWAARWEHDKGPDLFFDAMDRLSARGVDFRVSVIGEQFRQVPVVFEQAHARLAGRIDHWGYQPTRDAYRRVLGEADVVVSSAEHEFFGIAVVEAVSAGCRPVLPARLAYPEVFGPVDHPGRADLFHDGTPDGLADALASLAAKLARPAEWARERQRTTELTREVNDRFAWTRVAADLDDAMELAADAAKS